MSKRDKLFLSTIIAVLVIIVVLLFAALVLLQKGTGSTSEATESDTPYAMRDDLYAQQQINEATEAPIPETTEVAVAEITEEFVTEITNAATLEDDYNEDDTGDVTWAVGDNPRFVNNDEFLAEVPDVYVQAIHDRTPNDYLEVFSDVRYVGCINNIIYGESSEYYHRFTVGQEGNVGISEIAKDCDNDWPY